MHQSNQNDQERESGSFVFEATQSDRESYKEQQTKVPRRVPFQNHQIAPLFRHRESLEFK
jgi:hypothetical protein